MTSKWRLTSIWRRRCIPADNYVESNVGLRGKITHIGVEIRRHADNIPRAALPIIRQIDKVLVVVEREGDLITIEGPWTELHDACLLVEREVRDVDRARALIDRWRHPEDLAVRVYQHVTLVTDLVIAIGAVNDISNIVTSTKLILSYNEWKGDSLLTDNRGDRSLKKLKLKNAEKSKVLIVDRRNCNLKETED